MRWASDSFFCFGFRRRTRRWATATAMCGAVALLVVSIGCGGGSGGGGGGGGQGTPEGVLAVGQNLAYNAGIGYDLATGLGSVNALNFVSANLWAGAPPTEPPAAIKGPTETVPAAMLAIACALCLALLFVGLRRRQIRWSTAVLLLAFALSILNAATTRAGTGVSNRGGNQRPVASNFVSAIRH